MTATLTSNWTCTAKHSRFAPPRLSYAAALRGLPPRNQTASFTYGQWGCAEPMATLCMAASNPDARFIVFVKETLCESLKAQAQKQRVSNILFTKKEEDLRDLDYLVCDSIALGLDAPELEQLTARASKALKPAGLAAHRYKTHKNPDESLHFIISEFAPYMNVDQARTALREMKDLGLRYLRSHPIAANQLQKAIESDVPDDFFSLCETGSEPQSGTLDNRIQFMTQKLAYVGDADLLENYMELSVPQESRDVLLKCRKDPIYECIKDFATQRPERCDIWVQPPFEQSNDLAALYNPFTFGVPMEREDVPSHMIINGFALDLTVSPFTELLDLMTIMPICVGDFLHDKKGHGVDPEQAITALQLLVAMGVAAPMRSSYTGKVNAMVETPEWAPGYNSTLNEAEVKEAEILVASPVMGSGVPISAREALVFQALGRVGMKDSVAALYPELVRFSQDQALAAELGVVNPTPEDAEVMIKDVVRKSMIQWYAYGLLAA